MGWVHQSCTKIVRRGKGARVAGGLYMCEDMPPVTHSGCYFGDYMFWYTPGTSPHGQHTVNTRSTYGQHAVNTLQNI